MGVSAALVHWDFQNVSSPLRTHLPTYVRGFVTERLLHHASLFPLAFYGIVCTALRDLFSQRGDVVSSGVKTEWDDNWASG
jgi:hypothetical protein